MDSLTIVTNFYYIIKSKFNIAQYVSWMINFFKLKKNIVVFTNKYTFNYLFSKINQPHIKFVIHEIKDFKINKLVNEQQWKKEYNKDPEKKIHSIDLYKIWNEKPNFLKKSITNNYFNSSYFIYCDIGIFRNDKDIFNYLNWPKINKVKHHKFFLLNVNTFYNNEIENNQLLNFIYSNRIGGGIYGGQKEYCLTFYNKYYNMINIFLKQNLFIGKDQSVLANVYIQNKKNIDLIKIPQYYNKNKWLYLLDYFN